MIPDITKKCTSFITKDLDTSIRILWIIAIVTALCLLFGKVSTNITGFAILLSAFLASLSVIKNIEESKINKRDKSFSTLIFQVGQLDTYIKSLYDKKNDCFFNNSEELIIEFMKNKLNIIQNDYIIDSINNEQREKLMILVIKIEELLIDTKLNNYINFEVKTLKILLSTLDVLSSVSTDKNFDNVKNKSKLENIIK